MKGALVNILALGILCALIWFGGQYFEVAVQWRIAGILGALALWLIIFLWQRIQAIRTARVIEARLREQAMDQIANSRPAERDQLEDLERRMKEAIGALKASKLGTTALAELPWYIIIGPPGSGKSTALQASGLEFPKMGQGLNGIMGVGGTRNCEWWFTSEGILLDTAGRYTSVAEDRAEWLGFLGMIKKARSRKPINGALVALSVVDLIQCSEEQLEQHARAVRERLDELSAELEEVFPVYLLFTKCDLLAGFVESFESLGRNEREQPWGYTFSYEEQAAERYRAIFRRECAALVERLGRRRLELLAAERPPAAMQRLYSFPLQLASASERLGQFVERTFPKNPFREQPILRGFYFTSGTQEGRPIDQVLGALRSAFGQSAPEVAEPAPAEKKSYFLTNLFRKVIFPDKTLARSLASTERRRLALHLTMVFLFLGGTVLGLVACVTSFLANRGLTNRVAAGVSAVRKVEADKKATTLERLQALEELRPGVQELWDYEGPGNLAPLRFWGLYQGGRLNGPVRKLYFGELQRTLLGPAMEAMQQELAAATAKNADVPALKKEYGLDHEQAVYQMVYELLRAYLMLGGQLDPEKVEVSDQLKARNRWLRGLGIGPKDNPSGKEVDLAWAQLDLLLGQLQGESLSQWAPKLDDQLSARVRKKLEENYWVSQTYTQMRDTRASQAGTETTQSLFGPGAALFAPSEPVSKVFTQGEWNDFLSRVVGEKSEYLAAQYAQLKTPKSKPQIEAELKGYFELEARQRWYQYLDGLKVANFGDVQGAIEKLDLLGSPRSPLPALVGDVWLKQFVLNPDVEKATLVPRPPQRKQDGKPGEEIEVRPWQEAAQDAFAKLARAFEELAKRPKGERVYVLAEADKLRELDPLQATFKEVSQKLLDDLALQAPAKQESFVRRFFTQVLDQARDAVLGEALAEANARWKADVVDIYRGRLAGKYPFRLDATDDAPLPEVVGLINPVDGAVWRIERAMSRLRSYELGGRGLAVSGSDFQRYVETAKRLQQALFVPLNPKLSVPLKVKLIKRPNVRNLRFSLGEESFRENDLPPGTKKDMTWSMAPGAKLSLLSVGQEEWAHKDYSSSPWGLPRLLAAGKLDEEQSSGRTFRFSWGFDIAGQERVGDMELEAVREESKPLLQGTLFKDLATPPERVEQ